jgi:hypothetical protein
VARPQGHSWAPPPSCGSWCCGWPGTTRTGAAGIATTIKYSSPEWPKASIALDFDADPRLAALIIWDTGETELDLIDLHTDTDILQHHNITTTAEVDRLLREILTWLHPDSHSQPST